jgi:glucokinase
MAGEFGHMTIVAGGKACVCGDRGCWERYASEPGAVSLYTGERTAAHAAQLEDIISRAKAGERRAQATLGRVGEYLGIGIANVAAGVGLSRVVVSGRIGMAWQFVREPLNEAVAGSMVGRVGGCRWSRASRPGRASAGRLRSRPSTT